MPVSVMWDNDDEHSGILVFGFDGAWTWHECREAMMQAEFMAEDYGDTTSHVFDMTTNTLSQRVYVPLLQKFLAMRFSHRVRRTVIVEKKHFADLLSDMLRLGLGEQKWRDIDITDSLARARAIVQEV